MSTLKQVCSFHFHIYRSLRFTHLPYPFSDFSCFDTLTAIREYLEEQSVHGTQGALIRGELVLFI